MIERSNRLLLRAAGRFLTSEPRHFKPNWSFIVANTKANTGQVPMLEAIDREGRSVGQVIVGELKDDPLVKTDDPLNVVEQAG